MNTKKETPDVRVGDVWADNDPRMAGTGRELRVKHVDAERVRCIEECTGLRTNIARKRFRPTSSGYRLVERDGKAV